MKICLIGLAVSCPRLLLMRAMAAAGGERALRSSAATQSCPGDARI